MKTANGNVVRFFEVMKGDNVAMVINGEYSDRLPCAVCGDTKYTLEYIITSPVEKLYTFTVTPPVLRELGRLAGCIAKMPWTDIFKSLEIINSLC